MSWVCSEIAITAKYNGLVHKVQHIQLTVLLKEEKKYTIQTSYSTLEVTISEEK